MATVETMNEKLEELMENEQFVADMKKAETYEDASKVMSEYGIEVPGEVLETMTEKAREYLIDNGYAKDGELTEKGLELVSGGKPGVKGRTYAWVAGEFGCVAAIIGGVATGPVGWACLAAAGICGLAGILSMCW